MSAQLPKIKFKQASTEERHQIVNSYIKGFSEKDIVKELGFGYNTVHGIIKKYHEGKDYTRNAKVVRESKKPKEVLGPKKSKAIFKPKVAKALKRIKVIQEVEKSKTILGLKKPKVVPEPKIYLSDLQQKVMQSWFDEDCTISLKELREKVMNEMELSIPVAQLSCYMKKFAFSFKRIKFDPTNNDTVALESRAFYVNNFMSDILNSIESKVIFINEATFTIPMYTNKKLLTKKETMPQYFGIRKKNISIRCAMGKVGIVEYQTQALPFKMESFHQHIESIIVKLTQKNITEAIVIMDGKHINQGPDIKKFIETKGYRLICLPPNSPFLNPVEGMYTKWKELVREKNPQNENELFQVMDTVFSEISESDCNSYFEHMLNYLPKCSRKEEILD